MRAINSRQRYVSGRLWVPLCVGICLGLLPARSVTAQSIPRCTSADQCLSLGIYYYNNEDLADRAARQFKLVMTKYATAGKQAEQAQYFLGSYYQRKYYIQLRRQRKDDRKSLALAASEFKKYTDRYYKTGSGQWLADAFFNLGLVYLQLSDTGSAANELSKMRDASWRDGSVYIYQTVWSPDTGDVIDSYVPSKTLAEFALSTLSGKAGAQQWLQPGDSFDQKVSMLTKWCQVQKSKQAQAQD